MQMTNLMTRALGGATALAGPLITFDVASIRHVPVASGAPHVDTFLVDQADNGTKRNHS
jgi:hypothetical protein